MRTKSFAASVSLLVGALVACNGSTTAATGTASISGSVAGTSFTAASEVATLQPASSSSSACGVPEGDGGQDAGCVPTTSSSGQVAVIVVSNRDVVTCSVAENAGNHAYANLDLLTLAPFVQTGTLAAGTYPVTTSSTASSGAVVQFQTSTSTCGAGVNSTGSSGSVTLTEVSATNVSGTYNVTFGTEGTFSGSFDLPICSLVGDAGEASPAVDAGAPVCEP